MLSALLDYAFVMETMAERIKFLRESKGYTQEQLAKLCGVSPGAVGMWETGATKNIKNEPMVKLLRVLGTSMEFLVHGPDQSPQDSARSGRYRKPV